MRERLEYTCLEDCMHCLRKGFIHISTNDRPGCIVAQREIVTVYCSTSTECDAQLNVKDDVFVDVAESDIGVRHSLAMWVKTRLNTEDQAAQTTNNITYKQSYRQTDNSRIMQTTHHPIVVSTNSAEHT